MKVSAELPKFNRIEKALREAMLDLGRADKEMEAALGGKRTALEQRSLQHIQRRCKNVAVDLKKCWEDIFAVADGEKLED